MFGLTAPSTGFVRSDYRANRSSGRSEASAGIELRVRGIFASGFFVFLRLLPVFDVVQVLGDVGELVVRRRGMPDWCKELHECGGVVDDYPDGR